MSLKRVKVVLAAGATMASLAVVSVTGSVGASGATTVNWSTVQTLAASGPTSMAALVAAAKKEGTLNVIALPPNWANYGAMISTFSKKYDIKVNSENPNGSSQDEINAIIADKGRSTNPDVIDVGTNFAITAQQKGLLAPYRVSTWAHIPAALKQPNGYWFDDYGGFVAIGCNTAVVKVCPTSFAQMLQKGKGYKIGINNNPTASSSALAAVMAAAIANHGSLNNVKPGVDYFKTMNANGNFVATVAGPSTVQSGATNIVIWWDYLQASGINTLPGYAKKWKVVIPSDASMAEYYTQAINKSAPDPAAARLWEEFLYSTQGQNIWLQGMARPVELAYMT
ncbi:MAG: extracellular solute-binding protein, partial [Actinomycetales bacterium]|nr:extracellular solute-binding protein [Actinomycetales bacterium]